MNSDQIHFLFVTAVAVTAVVLSGAGIALVVGLALRKEPGSSQAPGVADSEPAGGELPRFVRSGAKPT
jgi:hypothetical protein